MACVLYTAACTALVAPQREDVDVNDIVIRYQSVWTCFFLSVSGFFSLMT